MTALPSDRSEVGFDEFKPPYDDRTAAIEANRCLYCHDAPCITACPTGIDIPTFIRKISTGNVKGAARTILDSNILGHSCARVCPVEVLCVGDCVYNALGAPPIQIGKLQRYATDRAAAAGWTFFTAGPDSGKRVAVVGGGPAGLAAAHRLRRFGHRVTLFEKRPRLGGLNSSGVAPYKVKSDVVLAEVERVLAIGGVEVRTGVDVPRDVSWQELLAYDALFLGVGLGPDTRLPGADLRGVLGAVEWIEQMKTGRVDVDGVRRVVVLGGGNTAIDVVREWLGLGVPEVTLAYRGTEAQMSGYAHEWSAAKDEGARVAWAVTPIGFEGRDGAVTGVRVARVDASKAPIPGTEHVLPADRVVLAVGQVKLAELFSALGLDTDKGRIVTGAGGATSRPGVYAGGDAANGGTEVVNAVAEGRDAAVAIHEFLVLGLRPADFLTLGLRPADSLTRGR